MEIPMIGC